ncbi:hypothetical protein [Desulfovibrio legallii]|uniref:Lipoprotein n=1 Tax=Desulfovibrio legallii TaxID=571438 RepID=A0A1G7LFQ8_9BACT|nr:hypothetical protein [Desulfovibrio legallii]SDF48402.1 hypothetical protein SAMN05192586_10662 [Desulfovibrio legallii]
MKSIRIVLYCSLLTLLLAACGPSNTVRLLAPPPLDGAVLPTPNAPRVTVVMFEDKRMDQTTLGQRRDKSAFVTGDNVPQWISKALADELARNGLQISYSVSVAEARKGNPDYLVTGQVDEAWINETSSTDMNTSLRVGYVLANRQARMVRESLNASQSRTGLPSGSAADNLMLETLCDLVKPMARKIVQTIETKK